MNSLRIVFAGTPEFGLPCLNALFESEHQLIAIYTQPDRPAGRGRQLQASAVKQWALQHELPIYQPLNFKQASDVETLKALKPDVLIVIAYGLILPKSVLDIPSFGCINVHASLLPRWRGASPIQQAILHGDSQTGLTIMQMDVGMDTGPTFCKVACPIDSLDTAGTLHDKLSNMSAAPLLATLNKIAKTKPIPQDIDGITTAPKINKEDAHINWQESASVIDRKIRAFHPWPVAFTSLNGTSLRIHEAKWLDLDSTKAPGTIIGMDKKGLLVATSNKSILIEKVQFPGSKIQRVADWLNSGKLEMDFVFK